MNPIPCPTCRCRVVQVATWRGFHYCYCADCKTEGPPALNPHHAVVEWNKVRDNPDGDLGLSENIGQSQATLFEK